MGMTIIKTPSEWEMYQRSWEQEQGIQYGNIVWGTGPEHYPCLVASLPAHDTVLSCYVYPEDAFNLIQAEGAIHGPGAFKPESVQPAAINTVGPTQDEFNKHITALCMAMLDELVEVKITNRERFESVLAKCVARVDQFTAEQHEGLQPAIVDILMGLQHDEH